MTSHEIIHYLNKTLQLTTEMGPLAQEVSQYSKKPYENISELEKKIVMSKVYLKEIVEELEDRYAFQLFIKYGLGFISCILLGVLIGFILAHR